VLDLTRVLPGEPRLIVTSPRADTLLWAELLNPGGYDVLVQLFDKREVFQVQTNAWLSMAAMSLRRGDCPRLIRYATLAAIGWSSMVHAHFIRMSLVCAALIAAGGCDRPIDPKSYGSAAARLKPVKAAHLEQMRLKTVYVPVYSSISWGIDVKQHMAYLAATVSIRNVSKHRPLIVRSVRYYDSAGELVREYLSVPSELAPLATVEFVVQQKDTAGGPGANFLIDWAGNPGMNDPIIEAVMVGQSGNAGMSFTSSGRTLTDEQ
jgi:hypothetical protein